jgi:hypothetical protein
MGELTDLESGGVSVGPREVGGAAEVRAWIEASASPAKDLLRRFVDGFPGLTFYRDHDAGLDGLARANQVARGVA